MIQISKPFDHIYAQYFKDIGNTRAGFKIRAVVERVGRYGIVGKREFKYSTVAGHVLLPQAAIEKPGGDRFAPLQFLYLRNAIQEEAFKGMVDADPGVMIGYKFEVVYHVVAFPGIAQALVALVDHQQRPGKPA